MAKARETREIAFIVSKPYYQKKVNAMQDDISTLRVPYVTEENGVHTLS